MMAREPMFFTSDEFLMPPLQDITGFLAFYNAYDNEKRAESHAVLVVGVDGEDGGIGQTGIDEATSNNISVYTS